MPKVTNNDMINAIVQEMPKEHSEKLVDLAPENILRTFEEYPTTKNAFIETLVNKVGKSLVFSKSFTNPLKALKKGRLEYGDSIEEIFVEMAQMKNFGEHWGDSTSTEGDLIRELKPKVNALYIKKNFDKKFKTTIKDKDLRKAFFNSQGLSNLIQRIATSLENGLNFAEYKYTKQTLNKFIDSASILSDSPTTPDDIYTPVTSLKQGLSAVQITSTDKADLGKELTEKIRAIAGDMQFMSDKYNLAKEITFSNPSDLVLFTTPATQALLDVNVIASAFNVSAANLNTRTVLIDELPQGVFSGGALSTDGIPEADVSTVTTEAKKVLAILVDQDFLQIWDTYQSMGTFNNPEAQYTNYFASAEGIFACCLFANICVFYQ